jgi:hypothetical protein
MRIGRTHNRSALLAFLTAFMCFWPKFGLCVIGAGGDWENIKIAIEGSCEIILSSKGQQESNCNSKNRASFEN